MNRDVTFAQVVAPGGVRAWTVGDWVIAIIVVAAVIAVLYVALQGMGITLPPWLKKIGLIVLVAVVAVVAVKLLLAL